MGVDVKGEGHRGVPEASRDDRRIDALGVLSHNLVDR
jgi:hypothetical protein